MDDFVYINNQQMEYWMTLKPCMQNNDSHATRKNTESHAAHENTQHANFLLTCFLITYSTQSMASVLHTKYDSRALHKFLLVSNTFHVTHKL